MTNKARIQIWITPDTHKQLNDFLKDNANSSAGTKASKGAIIDLGLQLLFKARKKQSLENIYLSVINGGNNE